MSQKHDDKYPDRLKDHPHHAPLSKQIFWLTVVGVALYVGASIFFVLVKNP